jgi:hypothetical protein
MPNTEHDFDVPEEREWARREKIKKLTNEQKALKQKALSHPNSKEAKQWRSIERTKKENGLWWQIYVPGYTRKTTVGRSKRDPVVSAYRRSSVIRPYHRKATVPGYMRRIPKSRKEFAFKRLNLEIQSAGSKGIRSIEKKILRKQWRHGKKYAQAYDDAIDKYEKKHGSGIGFEWSKARQKLKAKKKPTKTLAEKSRIKRLNKRIFRSDYHVRTPR